MKKTIRLMSFVLILLVLTSIFPLAGFAYGTDDSKLIVTHLNTSSPEGAGVILTPLTGTTVGSGFDCSCYLRLERSGFLLQSNECTTGNEC